MAQQKKGSGLDWMAIAIVVGSAVFTGLIIGGYQSGPTTPDTILFGLCFGAFVGFAALPYFDEDKWKPRPKICALIAAIGITLFAHDINLPIWTLPIAFVVGSLIGYHAHSWVKHF